MKTATLIKKLKDSNEAKQYLFKCDPPHKGNEYVIASAINAALQPVGQRQVKKALDTLMSNIAAQGNTCPEIQERLDRMGAEQETFIFAASKHGLVLDYEELSGSMPGMFNPCAAMRNAGYQIVGVDEVLN